MTTSRIRLQGLLALLSGGFLVAGCDETGWEPPVITYPSDALIAIHGGDDQAGPIGSVLPEPLAVSVTTADGQPVVDAPIRWRVALNEGRVTSSGPMRTGADGIARVHRVLGDESGISLTTATIEWAGEQVVFLSRAHVQGATRMMRIPGDPITRSDTVLATTAFRVLVLDHEDRPVPGVTVTWAHSRGTLASPSSITDADGIAANRLTHGMVPRTYDVLAAVVGLRGSPLSFQSTAGPGRPAGISKVGGDNQQTLNNTWLALPFAVATTDAYGNPAPGAEILWSLESATGPVALGQSTTQNSGDNRAIAFYHHFVRSDPGQQSVTASLGGGETAVSFAFVVSWPVTNEVAIRYWDEFTCWYDGICSDFAPSQISVSAGDTVRWTWDGRGSHNVVFEDDPTEPVSSATQTSGYHLRTFTTPGVIRYRCTLHSTSFTEGQVGAVSVH